MQLIRTRVITAIWILCGVITCVCPGALIAETIKIGGTGVALRTMQILGEAYEKYDPGIKVEVVPGLGSSGARKALVAGAIDIAATATAGNQSENVPEARAVKYGRSALVFATRKTNPVSAVTTREIVDIWSGKTIKWPAGGRLRLILRPLSDSDTKVLKEFSAEMEQAVTNAHSRAGMKIAVTDHDSADMVEAIEGALGTSNLALIIAEKRALKPLSFNGEAPSVTTVADGSYPFFKSLYLVSTPKSAGASQKFIDFVVSARNRHTLAQLGHVVEPK
jgi:phosphate transport system substrate-binding protein